MIFPWYSSNTGRCLSLTSCTMSRRLLSCDTAKSQIHSTTILPSFLIRLEPPLPRETSRLRQGCRPCSGLCFRRPRRPMKTDFATVQHHAIRLDLLQLIRALHKHKHCIYISTVNAHGTSWTRLGPLINRDAFFRFSRGA
jgi:hypothetical protein